MRSIFIALVIINLVVFGALWFARAPVVSNPVASVNRAPTPDGERLQLLAEMLGEAKKVPTNASVPKPTGDAIGASSEMCTMVGPFAQLLHAEYMVERLLAMELDAAIQPVDVPGGVGYWVYLAPEISEKEALRRLYEIQAKKVDSYIIPSGELANGISLGIFNERVAADQRVEELRGKGYEPQVREVARTTSETWVALPSVEAEKIDAEIWVDLLRQQPDLEKRQNFCLGVAPI
jgi:hypothetical protein